MAFDRQLRSVPFILFTLPLIAGVLVGQWVPWSLSTLLVIWAGGFFALVLGYWLQVLQLHYRWRWWFGALAALLFFFTGMANRQLHTRDSLKQVIGKQAVFQGVIVAPPVETAKSVKTELQVNAWRTDKQWRKLHGQVLVYFQQDSTSHTLRYGDEIQFLGELQGIENAGNPHQFNYARYLARHGIYARIWLPGARWERVARGQGKWLFRLAGKTRQTLLTHYQNYGLQGRAFEVAAALTLGYKDALQDETRTIYAGSGAMHILAVSGLHVGVVYMLLSSMLAFTRRMAYGRLAKVLLIILVLWLFALLTGLSPSVMRAALMFSIVAIAQSLKRQTNIYNTLGISAFALLIANPYIIYEVGFQLSYMAVFAIVFFQPKMYQWLSFKQQVPDRIWALTTVSIAAQLGTAPLGLYYFHQFPNYFLLTNLVVIPMASIILYLALVVFLVAAVPVINVLAVKLLYAAVWFLNTMVEAIHQLPGAVTEAIPLAGFSLLLIYGTLFLIALYWEFRRPMYLVGVQVLAVVFFLQAGWRLHGYFQRQELHVYQFSPGIAMGVAQGSKAVLMADSLALADTQSLGYLLKAHAIGAGFRWIDTLQMNAHGYGRHFQLANQHFFIVDSLLPTKPPFPDLPVDYLIMGHWRQRNILPLVAHYRPREVWLTNAIPYWYRNDWYTSLDSIGIPWKSTREQGAIRLTW